MPSENIKSSSQKIPTETVKKRRGLFFALIVLLGNVFLPLINNTKPAGFSLLYFAWMTAIWEVICVVPIWILEKRKASAWKISSQTDNLTIPSLKS